MSESDFRQKLRDGEALGIPRETTYKALKSKGYEIENDPANEQVSQFDASMHATGAIPLRKKGEYGALDIPATVVNFATDLGRFGYQALRHPLQTGKEIIKGTTQAAVGAAEYGIENTLQRAKQRYEQMGGKNFPLPTEIPTFHPDGTITYKKRTPEQEVAFEMGDPYGIPQYIEAGKSIAQGDVLKGIQQGTRGLEKALSTVHEQPFTAYLMAKGVKDVLKLPEGNPASFIGRKASEKFPAVMEVAETVLPESALNAPSSALRSVGQQFQTTAQSLYQSALKPTQAILKKYPNVVEAGLKEGIPVTKGALDRVESTIDLINDEIGQQIAASKAKGTVILTENVLNALDSTRKFFNESIGGSKYAEELDALADTFRAEQGEAIAVDAAQRLKVNTYQILRKAYGELKTAEVEGKKAIARGLKEEIVAAIPELKDLNLRESQLIGLERALERFTGRFGNRELVDLTSGIGGAVGIVAGGKMGGVKGFLLTKLAKMAIDNPSIKSRVALILHDIGKKLAPPEITLPEALPPEFTPINLPKAPASSKGITLPEPVSGTPSKGILQPTGQGSQLPINPLESPKGVPPSGATPTEAITGVESATRSNIRNTNVAQAAYDMTLKNGGVTLSLTSDSPKKGFAYAPTKGTQTTIPKESVIPDNFKKYIEENLEELSKEGNHVGGWIDETGTVYLDVSRVGENTVKTLQEAQNASQLAVYDLQRGKDIPLGKMEGKVYIPLDEAAHVYDQYLREVQGTGNQGSLGGVSEVPKGSSGIKENRLTGLKTVQGVDFPSFEGFPDLSTSIVEGLKGRTRVSKQFIEDLTNQGSVRQFERDLIRDTLKQFGGEVPVKDFAVTVRQQLLPLELRNQGFLSKEGLQGHSLRYEDITLPNDLRGRVKEYNEHLFESPIRTDASAVHFGGQYRSRNYFAHTRIEDMADGKTRRVIEVQSDLFQKGRFANTIENVRKLGQNYWDEPTASFEELSKLEPYRNTWHERILREEIKQAAVDGKTKLQVPTGETAMKIEGLGETHTWAVGDGTEDFVKLTEPKVGQEIYKFRGGEDFGEGNWIITDVLGEGKFKAVPKNWERMNGIDRENIIRDFNSTTPEDRIYKTVEEALRAGEEHIETIRRSVEEEFDISGKVDTNNPIYRFYEKTIQKYLKNLRPDSKVIKDKQGVEWIEVPIKPEDAKNPVMAMKQSSSAIA